MYFWAEVLIFLRHRQKKIEKVQDFKQKLAQHEAD